MTAPTPAAGLGLGLVETGTIAAIETATVSLHADRKLVVRGARGTHDRSDFVLVRVQTSLGAVGYGEVSATPRWSGEDAASATHFIRDVLGPALVGEPLRSVPGLRARMELALAGNTFTKAGLDTALWDALARTLGVRVVDLLGGPRRTEVPTKMSLSGDGDVLAGTLEEVRSRGFRSFKVKVGTGHDRDVARFRLARELAGEDTFLGADSNGGWTRNEAFRTVRDLAAFRPAFIEQPVAPHDLEGMRQVRALGLPVVADESVYGPEDVVDIIRAEAADVVSVYIGMAGGLGRAVQAIETANLFGLDALIGSNGEFGIGAAAQVHVACAVERLSTFPSDIIGHHYYDEDVLESPVDIDGLVARLPAGPGLGVEPNADVRGRFA
jgi:L-alanine-DL-glutamate epimerase-like enolase superfamily enzyme